jgi:outer membrane protein assembly factor BamE (lipoprotein component of BamABCDE complex)
MFFGFKYHYIFPFIFILYILSGCQLQEPLKNHGIIYLENRSNKLILNKSNKNNVIDVIGYPQIKTEDKNESWIYIERVLTKGKYHKLGKHILKENNVLVLNFDKYGILIKKDFLTKNDINKLKFSKKDTKNEITRKSFVQSFLQSVKQKMYQNRNNKN